MIHCELKIKFGRVRSAFWSSRVNNPPGVIEQVTYLLLVAVSMTTRPCDTSGPLLEHLPGLRRLSLRERSVPAVTTHHRADGQQISQQSADKVLEPPCGTAGLLVAAGGNHHAILEAPADLQAKSECGVDPVRFILCVYEVTGYGPMAPGHSNESPNLCCVSTSTGGVFTLREVKDIADPLSVFESILPSAEAA